MHHQPRTITSRANPLVSRFRAAHDLAGGEVLLEGATLAGEALAAGWPLRLLAVTDDAATRAEIAALLARLPPETDLVSVSAAVMDAISPARTPSGVVGLAGLPPPGPVFARTPALVVCAVDVQDPGNLGAIVRVAEAAGATGVMACGRSAEPYGWKALRGAMGSAFRLPLARGVSHDRAIAAAREAGARIFAATLTGVPPDAADLRQPVAVFVGSEGAGLPPEVVAAADGRIAVPMQPPVESLNVAVATAVVLYEARRQRLALR